MAREQRWKALAEASDAVASASADCMQGSTPVAPAVCRVSDPDVRRSTRSSDWRRARDAFSCELSGLRSMRSTGYLRLVATLAGQGATDDAATAIMRTFKDRSLPRSTTDSNGFRLRSKRRWTKRRETKRDHKCLQQLTHRRAPTRAAWPTNRSRSRGRSARASVSGAQGLDGQSCVHLCGRQDRRYESCKSSWLPAANERAEAAAGIYSARDERGCASSGAKPSRPRTA